MRVGQVIGKVVSSQQDPGLKGGRFLIVSPVDSEHLDTCCEQSPPISAQPNLVVYDNLGAGEGDIIGFVEGAEATAPFDHPIPIDVLCTALFDTISHRPPGPLQSAN